MFKAIKNYIRKRNERRLREIILLELIKLDSDEYNPLYINRVVNYILTGSPD